VVSWRWWAQQAALQRRHDRRRPVIHAQLGEDVDQVGLDGCLADVQRSGDVFVGGTPGDVLQHLQLAVAGRLAEPSIG
jgi:hypothetical protein